MDTEPVFALPESSAPLDIIYTKNVLDTSDSRFDEHFRILNYIKNNVLTPEEYDFFINQS
jgi:hypothetical protein